MADTTRPNARGFDLARLRAGIKPFRLLWFPRLRSTNDHAAVLRRRGTLFAPSVVLAGRQTAGRGRGDNVWWSAPGSLTATFVLPTDDRLAPHQLPLIAGLAVRAAAAELTGAEGIQLKWPNDLLYQGRKLGGLLCERVQNVDLVGIGLNVNLQPRAAPRNLRDRLATLAEAREAALDMTDAVIAITAHLREMVSRGTNRPFTALLHEYDTHHALIGRQVTILAGLDAPPLSGRCLGLDTIGRLLVTNRGKTYRVISGQVQLH